MTALQGRRRAPRLQDPSQASQGPSATEQPSWGTAGGSLVQTPLAPQPQRGLSSDPCGQLCPMPSLPLSTVPNLSPHGATPTPSHGDSELGQPGAGLGGGTSGFQSQLRATPQHILPPLWTSVYPSEIRDGGSPMPRALPILSVFCILIYID